MPPFPPALVGFALWRYAASHYDGRICPNALVRRAPARRQTLQRTQVALGPHYRVARMPPQSERQTPGRVPTVHDAEEVGGSSPPAPTITKPAPVLAIIPGYRSGCRCLKTGVTEWSGLRDST